MSEADLSGRRCAREHWSDVPLDIVEEDERSVRYQPPRHHCRRGVVDRLREAERTYGPPVTQIVETPELLSG